MCNVNSSRHRNGSDAYRLQCVRIELALLDSHAIPAEGRQVRRLSEIGRSHSCLPRMRAVELADAEPELLPLITERASEHPAALTG